MSLWFSASELPLAYGTMMFLGKAIRSINDNGASVFYEATAGDIEKGEVSADSLVMYQWIGLAICIV